MVIMAREIKIKKDKIIRQIIIKFINIKYL